MKQHVLLRLCTPLLLKTNKDKKLFILVGKVPKQKYGNSSPFSLVSSGLDNIVSLSREVLVKNANPPPPANLVVVDRLSVKPIIGQTDYRPYRYLIGLIGIGRYHILAIGH